MEETTVGLSLVPSEIFSSSEIYRISADAFAVGERPHDRATGDQNVIADCWSHQLAGHLAVTARGAHCSLTPSSLTGAKTDDGCGARRGNFKEDGRIDRKGAGDTATRNFDDNEAGAPMETRVVFVAATPITS
jgi:hypothetical protein